MKVSFRCFFPDGHYNQHYEEIHIRDIHLWMMAYKFTHPGCKSITVQVKWEEGKPDVPLHGEERENREAADDFQR